MRAGCTKDMGARPGWQRHGLQVQRIENGNRRATVKRQPERLV